MKKRHMTILGAVLGVFALALVLSLKGVPVPLVGRVLEGDEMLRVQVESDFDQDGDIDFIDFTTFAAFYEGE